MHEGPRLRFSEPPSDIDEPAPEAGLLLEGVERYQDLVQRVASVQLPRHPAPPPGNQRGVPAEIVERSAAAGGAEQLHVPAAREQIGMKAILHEASIDENLFHQIPRRH